MNGGAGDALVQVDEELPDLEALAEDPHIFEMEDVASTPITTTQQGEQLVSTINR